MAVSLLSESPITVREAVVPYSMAGVNMLAATLVARDMLSPQALLLSVALILIGLPLSIVFRQRQYHRIVLNLLIMVPLLALTWAQVRHLPGLQVDWSNFWDSAMMLETTDCLIVLLHIIVITAAGRAFILVTTRDLLQTPIPSVSIFLLAIITPTTTHPSGHDPFALLCLLVLLSTSLYLFSLAHSQLWFTSHVSVRVQRQLLLWTGTISILLFPLVVLGGFALQPFNMQAMSRRAYNQHHFFHFNFSSLFRSHVGISLDDSIDVGGARWPTGRQVIMEVQVDRPAPLLWRATTYAIYHDGTWNKYYHRRGLPPIPERANPNLPLTTLFPTMTVGDPGIAQGLKEGSLHLNADNSERYLIRQRYTIHAQAAGPILPIYGAYQIYQFQPKQQRFPRVSGDPEMGFNIFTADLMGRALPSYDIVSINKPSPNVFRLKGETQLSRFEQNVYLQMPDPAYASRIRQKAVAILAEDGLTPASDRYRIVQQFESYLGKHYLYTLKPSPPKHHEDPIVDFLYYQKKGYCNYFSGAMVLLCRSVGIPARFVVGFATGDPVNVGGDMETAITYRVLASHAHSWVEVFLPHYGWYTSDPTAGSAEAESRWGKTWVVISEMWAIIRGNLHAAYLATRGFVLHYAIGCIIGILVILLIVLLLILTRDRPPAMPSASLPPSEARALIIAAYHRMLVWLARWGVHKPQGYTAGEFSSAFLQFNGTLGDTVAELCALYSRTQYGRDEVTDADARTAIGLLHRLWEQGQHERRNLSATAAVETRTHDISETV